LASPHTGQQRLRLSGLLWDLLDSYRPFGSPRVQKCGWLVLDAREGVKVMKRRARCHLDNVMRCGLLWECPTCAAHIKAERAQEAEAAKAWHVAQRFNATAGTGWSELRRTQWAERTVVMATFTVRHGLGDDLETIRAGVADAWRDVQTGRWWTEFKERHGLLHYIRAAEVTYGDEHGFHPHLHVALFFATPPKHVERSDGERARAGHPAVDMPELQGELFARWRAAVVRRLGAENEPLEFVYPAGDLTKPKPVGVVVTPCNQANYLAKLGLEISAPNTKAARQGHVTPLDMLNYFAWHRRENRRLSREFTGAGADKLDEVFGDAGRAGDLDVGAQAAQHFNAASAWLGLYLVYVKAMRGARQLTWSRGFKVAAGIAEKTDEEVVAGTKETDELVTTVPTVKFNMLRRMPGVVPTLLELAETHGALACNRFVKIMCDDYTGVARKAMARLTGRRAPPEEVENFLREHGL